MMRVFVYEHLSGAAPAGAGEELLGLGLAMRDAVARDLLRVADCVVSVAAGPGGPDVPVGAHAVRPPPGASAVDFVAQQARLHDLAWVIAPETDDVLGELQQAVGAARWIGCSADAVALASSKRATLARMAEHGVLTPLAFATSPTTRRWVVKPDDGAGGLATRVHATLAAARDDAQERSQRGESATLEAWVAGEPLSISLLCSADRTELLSVNRQQVEVDAAGVLSFGGVQIDALPRDDARGAMLNAWAQTLVGAIDGLRGFVGIDLVWHPQRGPVLIEVNPRVTMAYVGLSAALGRNLATAVLAAHETEPAHAAA
ncbi:MAG: ATP-grasp domain-containing protein [Burkholderiales bacterium]